MPPSTFMTLQDIATRLQVNYQTIWRRWRTGEFPNALQVGKEVRIPTTDYESFVHSLQTRTASRRRETAGAQP